MKRILTISLLVIHILGHTEFGQLIHLPKIFEHYRWHSHIDPSIGFVEFLSQHYFGDDGILADNTEDNSLPFKQLHQPVNSHVLMAQPLTSFKSIPSFTDCENILLPYSPSTLSGYILSVLQPPDLAI